MRAKSRLMVAGIRVTGIGNSEFDNKIKESSNRRKYQAKTAKSKNFIKSQKFF